MKKILVLGIVLTVLLAGCQKKVAWVPDGYGTEAKKPEGPYVADNEFKMVAYCYVTRDPALVDVNKLKQLTHIHFAFLYPNADGTLKVIENEKGFKAFNELAKENGVKTAVSLAGTETIYAAIAADPSLRKKLVNNIVSFAVANNLDGVDIDWEYPRANLGGDVTFELFMKDLSAELHNWHKYLSMAVTAGLYPGPVKEGITKGALDAVDFVNLMAYDGKGTDPADPNHHSTYAMAEKVLNIWLNDKQLPKEKAVIGLPLYGKNTANVARTYTLLIGDGANPEEDSFILKDKDGDAAKDVTYYYNGTNTIKKKTQLARSSANGVMFWELFQDVDGANSLISAAYSIK